MKLVDAAMTPCPIDRNWIIKGAPEAHISEIVRSRDGFALMVLWTCEPGLFWWHYKFDETALILEGRAALDDGKGGGFQGIDPGSIVHFRRGTSVRWRVEDKVRKIAWLEHPPPSGLDRIKMRLRRLKRATLGARAKMLTILFLLDGWDQCLCWQA